jgi:hypothetical protein
LVDRALSSTEHTYVARCRSDAVGDCLFLLLIDVR